MTRSGNINLKKNGKRIIVTEQDKKNQARQKE
jgi:hypothetical protein